MYEKFFQGYTRKQWGLDPSQLDKSITARVPIRTNQDDRYFTDSHQFMPRDGYARMFERMLDHPNIDLLLGVEYREAQSAYPHAHLVFTGPIDEYFGFSRGKLKYRGQQRELEYLPATQWAQPCVQLNNPDPANGPHIRTIEWKHAMAPDAQAKVTGTLLTREITVTPDDPDKYEYPFPDEANASLYRTYAEMAQAVPNLLICGRLGEYCYYDMDQAIGRAQVLAQRLLDEA